jgi:hypothetical protein
LVMMPTVLSSCTAFTFALFSIRITFSSFTIFKTSSEVVSAARCGGAAANTSVERSQQQESDESDLVCAPGKWFVIVSNDDKMITRRGTHSWRVTNFFLNARTHEKRTTKTSREGTKMSCDGLTQGKIIFGYTPRVVLPPQQPVSNATMEQVQRWGEDVSNDGLDAI